MPASIFKLAINSARNKTMSLSNIVYVYGQIAFSLTIQSNGAMRFMKYNAI